MFEGHDRYGDRCWKLATMFKAWLRNIPLSPRMRDLCAAKCCVLLKLDWKYNQSPIMKQKLVNSLCYNLVRSTVKTVELNCLRPDWTALRKENAAVQLLAAVRLMMQLTLSTGATNTLVFSLKNALLRRNASFTQVSLSSSKNMYKICRIEASKMSFEQIVCLCESVFRTRFGGWESLDMCRS